MMRSLYSGVSGLQNHQTKMDVIGNNIANVNTIGFKKSRVNFHDIISQTVSGASKPEELRGGINPKQIGLGMSVATIDTLHTESSLQTTQKQSDLAITGNGYFVLKDQDNIYYTRAGAFDVDASKRLVNPANGMRVQGWSAQNLNGEFVINSSSDIEDIIIPIGDKSEAKATENVYLVSNLNKNTPIIREESSEAEQARGTWVITKTVFDSFGNENALNIRLTRDANTPNLWNGIAQINGVETNFTLGFDNNGALSSLNGNDLDLGQRVELAVTFPVLDANEGAAAEQTFNIVFGEVGSYTDSVTQFADRSTTKAVMQDGYKMGYLENFEIDQSGTIVGMYSNGTRREVAKIALASFTNPSGLSKAGDTTFRETSNSGDSRIAETGSAGLGSIRSGVLEMSNVDLATEFTEMIVTQRGFQANSKTITTSDRMLEELLQLKR